MIKKATNNTLYFLSIGLLCLLTYTLNYCTFISQCALIFTLIATLMNTTTFFYGQSKALKGLALATTLSFALLWNLTYYVDGKVVNGIVIVSFISLMISLYWSACIFQKLQNQCSLITSHALSFSIGTLIDGLIMAIFFMLNNHLSYQKILDIFMKECAYKLTYGLFASVIIAMALKIFKHKPHLNLKKALAKLDVTA